jgi:hypothetical protein
MEGFPIFAQSRPHILPDASGARIILSNRSITHCVLVGALLGLMGCGYAGRPSGPEDPQKVSTTTVIQATPSSIGFGNAVSGVAYSQSVQLSNMGTSSVQITQATTSGPGFSVSGLSLPLALSPGQNATFTASFISKASGSASGEITIASSSGDAETTIGMSATVVSGQLQLTPSVSALSFGNQVVEVSQTQNVTLTNTGNTGVSIATVAASGAGFSVGGGSGVTLAPGQLASLAVTFDPVSIGSAAGNLVVTSNASSGPIGIGLTGTGITTPVQHSVALSWNPSTSAVVGYFVYRGDGSTGSLSKLTASAIPTTTYVDSSVVDGQTYGYAVTSVDSSNVESGYSNQSSVTIPGN